MAAAALKRTVHARSYTVSAKLSRIRQMVTLRTIAAEIRCAIRKAAENLARWGGGRERVKARTGPPRGLSRVISAADGLSFNRSRPNGEHHLARQSEHHLARQSEHHLARQSEHHLASRFSGRVYFTVFR